MGADGAALSKIDSSSRTAVTRRNYPAIFGGAAKAIEHAISRRGHAGDRVFAIAFTVKVCRHYADYIGAILRKYDSGIVPHGFQLSRFIRCSNAVRQVTRYVTRFMSAEHLQDALGHFFVQHFAALNLFQQRHHLARSRDVFSAFGGSFQVHHLAPQTGVGQP